MGISFQPHTSSSHLDGPTITGMVIDYDGYVGIGTTSPDVLLKLNYGGDDPAGTNPRVGAFSIEGGHTTLDMGVDDGSPFNAWMQTRHKDVSANPTVYYPLIINPLGGKVGIGTNDPAYRLDVDDTSSNIAIFRSSVTNYARVIIRAGAAGDAQLSFQNNTSTKWTIGNDGGDSDKFKIETGGGAFGASPLVCILSGGNFGIGTASPQYALEVAVDGGEFDLTDSGDSYNRRVRLGDSSGNGGYITVYNDSEVGNVILRSYGDSSFTGGNVGIGLTTPNRRLHVVQDSTTAGIGYFYTNAIHTGTDTNSNVSIRSDHASSTGQVLHVRGDGSGDLLVLNNGGTNRVVVEAGGSVGIGTDAPDSLLEIENSSVAGNTQLHIHNNKAGDAAVLRLEGKRASLNDTGQLLFANDGNNVASIRAYSAADDGKLILYTSATSSGDSLSEAITIDTSQNVEINAGQLKPQGNNTQSLGNTGRRWNLYANTGDFGGSIYARAGIKDDGGDFGTNGQVLTTNGVDQVNWVDSPGAGSVDGSGTANYIPKWTDTDTIGNSIIYETSSKIGIGTNAPLGILSLPGADTTTKPQIRFQTGAAANLADAAISTTDDSGGTNVMIGSNQYWSGGSITRFVTDRSGSAIDFGYAGRMKFYTGEGSAAPTERMRIERDGNVGIGTTTPGSVLNLWASTQRQFHWYAGTSPSGNNYVSTIALGRAKGGTSLFEIKYDSEGQEHAYLSRLYVNATLHFDKQGSDHMTILADGNVGINDSSPTYKLDVNGTGRYTGQLTLDTGIIGPLGSTMLNSSQELINIAELAINAAAAGSNKLYCNGASNFAGAMTINGIVTIGAAGAGYDAMFHSTTSGQYMEWDASMSLTRYRDNTKAVFGNGDDLQIYHDGSNSYITDAGTGSLIIGTNSQIALKSSTENLLVATPNGAVTLYHNNAAKLATSSVGTTVTGILNVDVVNNNANSANIIHRGASNDTLVGNGNYLYVLDNGRVGIGSATPGAKLHVHNTSATSDGDGSATETISGQDSILLYGHDGSTNNATHGSITWLGSSTRRRAMITAVAENADSDYVGLAFYTRGTDGAGDFFESMRIAHSGSVEITAGSLKPGTNNAQSLGNTARRWNLYANTGDFGGSIYARAGIKDDGGDFGTNGQVLTTNGVDQVNWVDSPGAGSVDGSGTANYITRWSDTDTVGNSNIFDNGAIGIGTAANLNSVFNVYGGTSSGPTSIITCMSANATVGGGAGIFFKTSNNHSLNRYGAQIAAIRNSNDNGSPDLVFNLEKADATGSAERMRILGDGNVGIGTNNPAELLHVEGIARVDTGINHNGTTILNSSRQLINIDEIAINAAAAGTYRLYCNGTGLFSGALELDGGLKDKDGSFGTNGYVLTTDGSGDVTWSASPGAGSVDGSGTANYVSKWTDGDTIGNSQIFDNGTNVGIGIASPSTEGLEIAKPSADTSFNVNDQADSILVLRNSDSGSIDTGRFCGITMKINSSSAAAESTIRTQFAGDGDADLIFSTTKAGTGADRMVIDEDGYVGIGTTNPVGLLDVYSTGSDPVIIRSTSQSRATMSIRSGSGGDAQVRFQNSAASKWTIGNDGGDSNKFKIAVGSGAFAASEAVIVDTSGNLSILGTLTEASSIAIKENVETYSPSLENISKMRPVRFNKKKSKKKEVGLVAEELAEMFPELVETDEKGNPSGVNYSRAVAVLLHGFKELYKEVKELKEKI